MNKNSYHGSKWYIRIIIMLDRQEVNNINITSSRIKYFMRNNDELWYHHRLEINQSFIFNKWLEVSETWNISCRKNMKKSVAFWWLGAAQTLVYAASSRVSQQEDAQPRQRNSCTGDTTVENLDNGGTQLLCYWGWPAVLSPGRKTGPRTLLHEKVTDAYEKRGQPVVAWLCRYRVAGATSDAMLNPVPVRIMHNKP